MSEENPLSRIFFQGESFLQSKEADSESSGFQVSRVALCLQRAIRV